MLKGGGLMVRLPPSVFWLPWPAIVSAHLRWANDGGCILSCYGVSILRVSISPPLNSQISIGVMTSPCLSKSTDPAAPS